MPAQKFDLLKFSRERAKFYIAGRLDNADNGRIKISCHLYASQTKDLDGRRGVYGEPAARPAARFTILWTK